MSTARTIALLARRRLWHRRTRVLLGTSVSLLVGFWMVREIDWAGLGGQFEDFPTRYALASLFLFTLATVLRAYRWQVLFVRGKVPLFRMFLVQNAGIGLNNVSPVRVLSEDAQYVLLTLRYRVKREVVVATLGIQRVQDFVIGALLLGVGLMVLPHLPGFVPYVLGSAIVAVISVLTIPAIIWLGARSPLTRVPLLASTASSLQDLVRARIILAFAFLLTLGYWLLVGLSAWVLAYGMGIEISLLVATLAFISTLTFTTLVPSLPAAVGTFEFAIYYILKSFDVAQSAALGYALVIHAVLFLPPMLIALLAFSGWALRPRPLGVALAGADSTPRGPRVISGKGEKPG